MCFKYHFIKEMVSYAKEGEEFRMKKQICNGLLMLGIVLLLQGCGQAEEPKESVESVESVESAGNIKSAESISENETEEEVIRKGSKGVDEIEEIVEKYEKKELSDLDFQVEYQGITITKDTSKEELLNVLGYPNDFETYTEGVNWRKSNSCSWSLVYPDYKSESQGSTYMRINLESDLDVDDDGNIYEIYSHIRSIQLEGIKTTRKVESGDTLETVLQEYGYPDHIENKYNEEYVEMSYIKNDVELIFTIGMFNTVISTRLVFPHESADINVVMEMAEKYEKKELTDSDFQVEYEGFTINKDTTEEQIIAHLGYPEKFEPKTDGGDGGYISSGNGFMRWNLIYPIQELSNEIGQPELRIILLSKIDIEDTEVFFLKDSYIASVWFDNIETMRGIETKDTLEEVLEAYGRPDDIQEYSANNEYIEISYKKDNIKLVFVIGPSMRIKDSFLDINMEKADRDQFGQK